MATGCGRLARTGGLALLLLLAGLLGYWLAQSPSPDTPSDTDTGLALTVLPAAADEGQCENILPDNGSTTLFPEGGLRSGDAGTELGGVREVFHDMDQAQHGTKDAQRRRITAGRVVPGTHPTDNTDSEESVAPVARKFAGGVRAPSNRNTRPELV